MKKNTLVIGGIIVVVIIGVVGFIMMRQPVPPAVEERPVVGEKPIPPIEKIVHCGEIGPDEPDPQGEVEKCFEERFRGCKPATLIISMDFGLGGLVSYHYEIIGPSDDLCKVKSEFLKNPNPEWVNKEMICFYDPAKNFDIAVQDMSRCKGPLYELMTGKVMEAVLPANTLETIGLMECNEIGGRNSPVTEDGKACMESEIDLGTIRGFTIDDRPVQCCVKK